MNSPLRRSLQARVVVTATTLGALTMILLLVVMTTLIRNGLFEARKSEALREAAEATARAQSDFDASQATSSLTAVAGTQYEIRALQRSTSARAVLIAPAGSSAGAVPRMGTDVAMWPVWEGQTPFLGFEATARGHQVWQAVALPGEDPSPGIVVAAPVHLVEVDYQLAFVFDLANEQRTLTLIQRILAIGGTAVLLILSFITWMTTRQAVRPIQEAAAVAEKIASGALGERLEVRREDELGRLGASFNEMAATLQEQIEQLERLGLMQRRFVSDVSHELRTPLTTIRMAGDILYGTRQSFPPEVARSAELLAAQIDRFDILLADLLEISRFDAGAADLDSERRDIREIVTAVLDGLVPLAESKQVRLRRYLAAEPAWADIDARRISRIVRNFAANAIEHADGKPVDVHVAGNDQAVAVVVRDYGTGMSQSEVAHVFDRFWRADPARARTTGGTGLGLAIALEDAHLHGGSLDAWGELGEGASFRLVLPRVVGASIPTSPLELVPANPDTLQLAPAQPSLRDPGALPDLEWLAVAQRPVAGQEAP